MISIEKGEIDYVCRITGESADHEGWYGRH